MKKYKKYLAIFTLIFCSIFLNACDVSEADIGAILDSALPDGDNRGNSGGSSSGGSSSGGSSGGSSVSVSDLSGVTAPAMKLPSADGTQAYTGTASVIDYSNASEGYVMVKYTGSPGKIKVQIINGDTVRNYDLRSDGVFEVYPFTVGNGTYTVRVLINTAGTKYATIDSIDVEVSMPNPLSVYLYPNQYVNYDQNSQVALLSAKLSEGTSSELGKITNIYTYVLGNIEYDYDEANSVIDGKLTGYLPVVDEVYQTGKGICFDYAVLMTAMLRMQGIPAQLVIGHAGDVYHAWVNVYSSETGAVLEVFHFNGSDWVRMDPTFAATANSSTYVGDGASYREQYIY